LASTRSERSPALAAWRGLPGRPIFHGKIERQDPAEADVSALSRNGRGAGHFVLCKPKRLCYTQRAREHVCRLFLGSSAVEHSTVNRMVAGSNPARGANLLKWVCWISISALGAPASFWQRPAAPGGSAQAVFTASNRVRDPGAAGSAAILSLRWWMHFSPAMPRHRAGARHRVDADQRKQCVAERPEAYAAFRLAMTCLKSVTNST
jgi:hypothetical protein